MAFGCCTNLASVSLPESVTRIRDGAFYECSSLAAISIPQSVTSIGESTFARCTAITSITIPENVTTLGEYSFEGCTGLISVSFLSSETNIKPYSFIGCSHLTAIYSFGSVPPEAGFQCFDDTHYQTVTLYVPQEAIAAYRAAETWKEFRNIQGFDPTGINGIEVDGSSGKEACYDLAGRRLNAPKKGVNIINGKKVVMR